MAPLRGHDLAFLPTREQQGSAEAGARANDRNGLVAAVRLAAAELNPLACADAGHAPCHGLEVIDERELLKGQLCLQFVPVKRPAVIG